MEKKDTTTKLIIITALHTLYFLIVGVFFCVASLSVLAPNVMIGFYNDLNMQSVKAYMYERVYDNTNKIEDLYNVIEVNISCENYEHVVKYIKVMQNRSGYADFCEKINARNIQNIDKKYYVYLCDYDSFLRNQYVNALYHANKKDRAREIAFDELTNNSNSYAWEFGAYIDCVMTDNSLTENDKIALLSQIYDTELNGLSVQELINNNIDMLDDPDGLNGYEKLRVLHQLIIIKITNKYFAQAKSDNVLVDALNLDIESLTEDYDNTLATL